MGRILVIAEHDGSELNPSTARCLSCAGDFSGLNCDIAVLAKDGQRVCEQAAALHGVSTVIRIDHDANEHALAAVQAPQIAKLAEDYSHVLGPSTTFGKDLMPRVAALLSVAQVSDIMSVISPHSFQRPIFAGNAIVTVETRAKDKVVATVRTASYQAAAGGGNATIESRVLDVELPTHTRYCGTSGSGDGGRPDLQSASIVISGGRGVGSEKNFALIYQLADRLGAAVGASRAAVDAGYIANDHQVGQTGKIISPDLYIAIGISGAIQHITGIKDAGTIVAINKDADAPIFEIADIGLVGDLFNIIPEFEKLL
ncbi:MAG: electron transfer flavoprotein subunit alpha/FixB family protein [Gammaproteobacteria bacterium]|nr:MAG: electron transfer flavoprotein subunit alpha/FixB family protein [Gammaproteobacteria bacterium]